MALGIRSWIIDRLVGLLTEPLPDYERRGWNDPDALRRHIRKGDVLLVDGDSRVSAMIKYPVADQSPQPQGLWA